MTTNIVTANPGVGGALFKVDLTSGTTTPYMLLDSTQVFGSVGVTNTVSISGAVTASGQVSTFASGVVSTFAVNATGGQVSTFPIGTTMVNIVSSVPLGFTPTGTSYVTIASTQIAIGGGQQYSDGTGTSVPIGTVAMWKSGAANSSMVAVSSTQPLPIYQVSSNPLAISGTTQVNIVSSVALGFTPTGTSMVNIVSSVALGFTPTGTSMVNVVSTLTKAPLDQISSSIFVDNAAYAPGVSKMGVVGGYYVSTATPLAHSDAGAMRVDSTGAIVLAPGSAETVVSTTPVVRVAVYSNNDQQITGFGSGTQYVNNSGTSQPTGMVQMWGSGAANSTMVMISSSNPLPIYQISTGTLGPLGGTSMVNIVSSIPLGGGQQYVNNAATSQPTGNVNMWATGAANSTIVAISSTNPLPVYQISTGPLGPLGGVSSTFIAGSVQQSSFVSNVVSTFVTGTQSTTPIAASQGGLDVQWYPSVTTAPRTIKNSAGRLYDIWFTNNATSARWMKLYNASSASVSTGTTAPILAFGLPAMTTSYTVAASGWLGSGYGLQFSTAIAVCVTASSATSTDTSAPGTNEVNLVFGYK